MAQWNPDALQPVTKIQQTPATINPNFHAQEEGDKSYAPHQLNLKNRTLVSGIGSEPDAVEDSLSIFCKEDVDGLEQLYVTKPSGQTEQISTSSLDVQTGFNGYTAVSDKVLFQWGRETLVKNAYMKTITFPKPFSSEVWVVLITLNDRYESLGKNGMYFVVKNRTSESFVLQTYPLGRSGRRDVPFSYTAIGEL